MKKKVFTNLFSYISNTYLCWLCFIFLRYSCNISFSSKVENYVSDKIVQLVENWTHIGVTISCEGRRGRVISPGNSKQTHLLIFISSVRYSVVVEINSEL